MGISLSGLTESSTGNLTLSAASGNDVLIGNGSTQIFIDGGTDTLGIGGTAVSGSRLNIETGAVALDFITSTGTALNVVADTVNDTSGAATIAIVPTVQIGVMTYTSTNSMTYTDTASLYIAGIPAASTNVTFTNAAYALWVDDGAVRFDDRTFWIGGIAYEFPANNGNANEMLLTDGSGNLSWSSVASASAATTVTVTDNESTNESNLITFVAGAASTTGNYGLEMDGDFHYSPNTGTVTATKLVATSLATASGALEIDAANNTYTIGTNENAGSTFQFLADRSGGGSGIANIDGKWDGELVTRISMQTGSTNAGDKDDGHIVFQTKAGGVALGNILTLRNDKEIRAHGNLAFQQAATVSTSSGNLTLSAATGSDVLIGDNATILYIDGGTDGVGIGKAPTQKLEVKSATSTSYLVVENDANSMYFGFGGDNNGLWHVVGDNNLTLRTNSADRLIVDGNGNVGIGTDTSPDYLLDVQGTLHADGAITGDTTIHAAGAITGASSLDIAGRAAIGSGASVGSTIGLAINEQQTDPAGLTGINQYIIPTLSSGANANAFQGIRVVNDLRGNQNYTETEDGAQTGNAGISVDMVQRSSAGTVTEMFGVNTHVRKLGDGAVTTAAAYRVGTWGNFDATNAITTLSGLHVTNPTATGGITTLYGIKIDDLTTAGTEYSIYTGSAQSYFGGNVGIGVAPSHNLTVYGTSGATQLAVQSRGGTDAEVIIDADAGDDSKVLFANEGTNYWVIGNDNGTGDDFIIADGGDITSSIMVKINDGTGDVNFYGDRIDLTGATSGASRKIHIENTSNNSGADALLELHVGGTSAGDPKISFGVEGIAAATWALGVDNSDSDKFVISANAALGTDNVLTLTDGGNVGIGVSPGKRLDVKATGDDLVIRALGSNGNVAAQIGATNTDEGYFDLLDGASTKVRISANMSTYFNGGNVGIGITAPDTLLHVKNSVTTTITNETTASGGDAQIILKTPASNTGGNYIIFQQGVGGGAANNMTYLLGYTASGPYFRLQSRDYNGSAGNSDVFRVTDGTDDVQFMGGISTDGAAAPTSGATFGGNVGIGTTAPAGELEVTKSAASGYVLLSTYSATDAHRSQLTFRKSGSNTIGTGAATADDEQIGGIRWEAYAANNSLTNVAGIFVKQDAALSGNERPPTRMEFSTADRDDGLPTRMTIDSAGNVGIGEPSPTLPLVIYATGTAADIEDDPVVLVRNHVASASWSSIRFQTYTGYSNENWYIGAHGNTTAANRRFSIANQQGTEVLTANWSGKVGIGTTTPSQNLEIITGAGTNSSGFHLGEVAGGSGGEGLYMSSTEASNFTIAGGAEITGGSTIAREGNATSIVSQDGTLRFNTNTGLTDGSAFTPTERLRIENDGNTRLKTAQVFEQRQNSTNGVIHFLCNKTAFADNAALDMFTITTTNESGNSDGGSILVDLKAICTVNNDNEVLYATADASVKNTHHSFCIVKRGNGYGVVSTPQEHYESTDVSTGSDYFDGVAVTVDPSSAGTNYAHTVRYALNFDTANRDGDVLVYATIVWHNFQTPPVVADA